ncbi:PEGA domain-containing protein [Vibrio sp. T187]|uniref:SUMF1/EgtB/PvdO family nonheme iron enzyme n=1 Tax=Vibrio TaxID=662 RepID=UPI0010CA1571|nr:MULTISPECIES: SUMF1/EgtB/PvdO family nonheme iron enzyme [Vibrio]MBW3695262.1 PEGA domain-containing protein [Vibrio sp. T187]
MRKGIPALLFTLAPCLVTPAVLAEAAPQSVTSIESTLFTKHSDLADVEKKLAEKQNQVDNQQEQIHRAEQSVTKAEASLQKAKAQLERDYARMINEPELDISPAQTAYQAAWQDVKQSQAQQLEAQQTLQDLGLELSMIEADKMVIDASIHALNKDKLRARAERLRKELTQTSEQKVSFTNTCQTDMTLAQCSGQTTDLALQKAVNQFQSNVIDDSSESKLIKQNLASASLNIHVLNHKVETANFYDNNKHKAVVSAQLETRPAKNAPCRLLGIDSNYCFDQGETEQAATQKEVAWVSLTVRSNQYNDKVTIDGVNYGSTPVEVMLPVGPHMVTIEKEGYKSFHQQLTVKRDHNLRAVLREKQNNLSAGDKFADAIGHSTRAPELIIVGAGEYFIGENTAQQVRIPQAFALAATPTSVGDFKAFIEQTGYQTDAELKNTCNTIHETEVTPIPDSYWRNPGFKQTANNPVVCVSRNDATAYVKWLSQQTGFTYRLPSDVEWEVAARSGNQTDYWWGDSFGAGQANTGWAGTPWSNQSTSPVKSFPANSAGFYDMVGNVWEWTNVNHGLAKGGAWSFSPNEAKAYSELNVSTSTSANYLGFRVLRQL